MPRIAPFRADRYKIPNLKSALCPPYDIIGEAQARRLRKAPFNAIHIELPEGPAPQKYSRARKIWEGWKSRGVLSQDPRPAFYVYRQTFRVGGKKLARTGFFCELVVEKPGAGSVLRHELTLSKPKEDRLNLVRALQVNSSPIFGLFRDSGRKTTCLLRKISRSRPIADVEDGEGVRHQLWRLQDPAALRAIQAAVRKTPVLIADGHHRYETSWNYRREAGGRNPRANSMLFFICPLEDPGLAVFPTHRILVAKMTLEQVAQRLGKLKDFFRGGAMRSLRTARIASLRSPRFIVTDGKSEIEVRPRSLATAARKLRQKNRAWLNLSLVHLHSILFPEMKKEDFLYTHDTAEALSLACARKTCAILVPATSVRELEAVVRAGLLMPQKSTYFYPKLITGLVFRSLEE